ADLRIVLGRAHSNQVELSLVLHVRLKPFRRLAAITGRPAAAIHLAQHILCFWEIVLDLDVLEHLISEAELLRYLVYDLEIVLAFEHRLDDLLAPLQRPVRGNPRTLAFELRGNRQEV